MSSYLGACLAGIAADLPPALVPAPDALERFVTSLPISFASDLFLECRLSARLPPAPVDVLVRLTAPEDAAPRIHEVKVPGLGPIQAFLHAWRDAPLDVHDIWLEFDRGASPGVPFPSLFFGPRGGLFAGALDDRRRAIIDCLRPLVGASRADEAAAGLFDCIGELPLDAQVFHVGVMLSRPTRALRVCVMELPLDDVGDYLRRIAWPGPHAALDRARSLVAPWIDRVTLALDVDGRPQDRLGLECYTDRPAGLLMALVERGLCSAEQATALLAWPGHRTDAEHFPDPLGRMARLLEGRRRSVLHRALSHLKLVLDPSSALLAKAYLSIQHRYH